MANTPEGTVKAEMDEILESVGAYYINAMTSDSIGNVGHADKICCVAGVFIAAEAKAGENKPTERQKRKLRDCLAAGGYACVVNETNLEEFRELLEQIERDPSGMVGAPAELRVLLPSNITLKDKIPNIKLGED